MPNFPVGFDPSMSVLFLGAGFSAGATNVLGRGLPAGTDLEKELKLKSDLPAGDPSELQDLAGYAESVGVDLQKLLSDLYTVRTLNDDQKLVLSHPWLRIYTTNYDDSCRVFYGWDHKVSRDRIYSIEDQAPKHLRPGAVIHLHGYIHRVSRDNALDQLVLSRDSYVQQRITSSVWWDFFGKDVRICENLFFVGYDLRDLEPAKYLTKQPNIVGKTHFILRPANSPVAEQRLSGYGARHPIGVAGFAQVCKSAAVRERPAHANALHAFRYVDVLSDGRAPVLPTPAEVQSLYAFGNFRFSRLISTYPALGYVVPRAAEISRCLEEIGCSQSIILHSKIGNGKSIFWRILSLALSQGGYQCFEIREDVPIPEGDIDFLRGMDRPVVCFPSFDSAYSNIHLFSNMPESARYVIEMRTSTLEVRQKEVYDALPGPIFRMNLNRLSKKDCSNLFDVLDSAGVAPPEFGERFARGGAEFRDIVLSLYRHPVVAERIGQVVQPILSDSNAKVVFFYTALLKSIDAAVDPNFIRSISNIDVYEVLANSGEITHEFVKFSQDSVEPHSSIFSEYMIKTYLKPHEIVGTIFHIASEAARRINEEIPTQSDRFRSARSILSSVMRYGFILPLMDRFSDREVHLRSLYERLRRDEFIKMEPLFWLQYSIFMQDAGQWDLAERHMETAYARALARTGFRTFQLDTNYLGLCLDLERLGAVGTPVERFEKILELLESCRTMIGDGSHRAHVIKVLARVEDTVSVRGGDLSRTQASALVFELNLIGDRLDALTVEEKASWGTEPVRMGLSRSVSILARSGQRTQ